MRILIVRLTSLGDVIHTLPAVSDAAKLVPSIQIDWLVEDSFRSIPGWHGSVSKIYTAATRRWRKQPGSFVTEIRLLSKQLKSGRYDLIIDAQGLLKSATLARLANGKRVGYDKFSIKESLASRLYDEQFTVEPDLHAVMRTRQLFASALGYQCGDAIDYGLKPDQFLKPDNAGDYLVFLHGTSWQSKLWPVQYWQQLAQICADKGYQVMLLWGDNREQARAQQIAENELNAIVCPRMDLDQIAGLLSHSAGIVAVDTGLGHLAAALSVPCLNLYGATDSSRTGTIGTSQIHLQADFQCSPCLRKQCDYKGVSSVTPACFEQFGPQVVWQQLEQLISVNQ